jgi:ABC-2 type transport system permease protein
LLTVLRFVGAVFWRDARLAGTSRVPFLFDVLGVVAALGIYHFVSRFVGHRSGVDLIAFVTAGIAVMQLQAGVVRAIQGLDREQGAGGVEMLLVAPVRATAVCVAIMAFPLARGLLFALATLVAGRAVFGVDLALGPEAWPGIVIGLGGAALGFLAIAMVCFGVLIAWRQGPAAASAFALAIPILSGVYSPVSILPEPLHTIAQLSPLARAVTTLREAVSGGTLDVSMIATMLALLAILLPAGALLCELVVLRARRLGTLGHA